MEPKEKVLETLKDADQALRSGDITKLSGLDKKDVDKAMNVLKSEGKIFSPKRCFWQVK
ncbi:MAG: MarR family transcriptional regulator [Bacteroidales bacterium]|nr:MAG: MarR family transcriptional regulator [Bacteroidales bacterium]